MFLFEINLTMCEIWSQWQQLELKIWSQYMQKKTPSLYFLLEYTPYLNIDSFAHFEVDNYNLLTAAFALLLSIEVSMTLSRC
jgi:hypothetical protein